MKPSRGWMFLSALACLLSGCARNDPPQAEAAEKALPGPTRLYFGISACAHCHTKPAEPQPVLCRCVEAGIWETEDKHKDAFQVLKGDRARQMGELLHIQGKVWEEKRCVACHGVYVADAKLRHQTFKEEDGVSCVACHGAYREWVALHGDVLERENWRSHSRKLKEDKYGMRDLWDPAKRARLCASCHVGNVEEGKAVTHAMYAAGHPPLPGVEIATFSDAMPRHWQYLKEKKPEVQKMLRFASNEAAFEQTQLVVVSAVVVLHESLSLLAWQAAQAIKGDNPDSLWPELAQFDCAACHHDLRQPNPRQPRGHAGKLVRPPLRRWPTELAGVFLEQFGGAETKDFRAQLRKLRNVLDSQLFGKPKEVAATARQLAAWLDQRLRVVAGIKFDRATALQLLRRLSSLPGEELPDYDSARQRVWALRIIYDELSFASGSKPAHDRAIRQILEALGEDLRLNLPAGRKRSIVEQLPAGLKKAADYDPAGLKRSLGEFAKLLPEN